MSTSCPNHRSADVKIALSDAWASLWKDISPQSAAEILVFMAQAEYPCYLKVRAIEMKADGMTWLSATEAIGGRHVS